MATRGAIVCLTTVAGPAEAEAMAGTLVAERLAACVNEVPVRSTYRWKGKLERSEERLLVIKADAADWERLCARIRELSTYEVPELVALEPHAVGAEYLAWLLAETGGDA